jgi:hypothetical protein
MLGWIFGRAWTSWLKQCGSSLLTVCQAPPLLCASAHPKHQVFLRVGCWVPYTPSLVPSLLAYSRLSHSWCLPAGCIPEVGICLQVFRIRHLSCLLFAPAAHPRAPFICAKIGWVWAVWPQGGCGAPASPCRFCQVPPSSSCWDARRRWWGQSGCGGRVCMPATPPSGGCSKGSGWVFVTFA